MLLERAQNGAREEIADLVSGDSSDAGCLLSGYLLIASAPEKAKDLLSKARRSSDAEIACWAAIYEARAYEYLGQRDEGKILIRSLLDQELSGDMRAQALLVLAVFQVDTPKRALSTLNGISVDALSPGCRARVFTLRAKLQSDLGRLDEALISYAGAAAYFEEVGDTHGVAHTLNNRANVERKLKRYADAHASVDKAISLIGKLDPFMAQFLDVKARICVAENNFAEAERLATKAVALVHGTDRQAILCENLCTLGRACVGLKKYSAATAAFESATRIARQLEDLDLRFKVISERKQAAQEFLHSADAELAEIALQLSEGSLRTAGKRLGLSHTGVRKILARNSQKWKPKKPLKSICKPVK